jgi:hypothetical protein
LKNKKNLCVFKINKMKPKPIYLLMVCIVMGMTTPTFAVSPDKTQGDKTKTESLSPTPIPAPPTTWNVHVYVPDTIGQCSNFDNCKWSIYVEASTSACIGLSSWSSTTSIIPGTQNYPILVPVEYPCVIISLIKTFGPCLFTPQSCCECQTNNKVCTLDPCL